MKSDGCDFNKKLLDVKIITTESISAVNYRPELDTYTYCNEKNIYF